MATRIVEGKKPYTGGKAISIDENKVISLNLREENNLIIYDEGDDEIYVDLQLPDGIRPLDAFPVGITVGRVLIADDWDVTGTLACFKTTSGDNIKLLYGDDGKVYIDNGTGIFKQIYLKGEVDALLQALKDYVDAQLALKQDKLIAGDYIEIDDNVISAVIPTMSRFLSIWNASNGTPVSFPASTPFMYTTGDYYLIEGVGSGTNYRPTPVEYDGTASNIPEPDTEIADGDVYIYDGAVWLLQENHNKVVRFQNIAGNPYDNTNLATALNAKANTKDVLTKTNTTSYTPSGDYNPATKKYVDDNDTYISSTAPSNPVEGMLWYDTVNDKLKVYNGSTWDIIGDDSANINTKTFFLASTLDLTNAQAAYDWYAAGKNPILRWNNDISYISAGIDSGRLVFHPGYFKGVGVYNNKVTTFEEQYIKLVISNGTVTQILKGGSMGGDKGYLDTSTNYSSPYTPLYDGSPTTKKYVDDGDTYIGSSAPTSNLVEGRLWYDTTNDILKVYDGTNWNPTGKTYTAGDHISISNADVISTTGLQEELTAGDNINIGNESRLNCKGPCPNGFHIPSNSETISLVLTWYGTLWDDYSGGSNFQNYFKLPPVGITAYNGLYPATSSSSFWECSTSSNGPYYFLAGGGVAPNGTRGSIGGAPIRPFKDTPVTPDSSWTMLYDGSSTAAGAGIFWNSSLGLISVSKNGTTWITIADKNLGATTVWNSGDPATAANAGNTFQWGNNYPFTFAGTWATDGYPTRSATTVDTTGYGPGNYYYNDIFRTGNNDYARWDDPVNNNLWGGTNPTGTWNELVISATAQTVVSGDAGVTYIIKISNSDPASGTAGNVITLIP